MGVYVAIKSAGPTHEKYLSIVENYRDSSGKKKQRTIKSFGKLKELQEKDPQIIDKLKLQYEQSERTETNQMINRISESFNGGDIQNFEDMIKPQTNYTLFNAELNYGIWAIKPIWNDWLNLYYKLNHLQEENTKLKCNVSEIAQYVTALKIVDPHSYFCAFRSQYKYLNNPVQDYSINDIYNTLEFIGENRSTILNYVNKRIVDKFGRSLTMVFYDCSNVYFETPYDDRQQLFRTLMSNVRDKPREENKDLSENQILELSRESELINKTVEQMDNLINEDTCWRMRGLSKEHRYDLPLVSIALVIDDRGIPVDFDVFPGNFSEYNTMPRVIGDMKKKYNIKDAVVVADRGLNSVGNIEMLVKHGLGFIVAQKVSNLKPEYEKAMLDHSTGYKLWTKDNSTCQTDEKQEYCTRKDDLEDHEIVYKRIPFVKEGMVKGDNGKNHKVSIECEILFTFSPKRYKRDIAQLEEDVAKARDAVSKKRDMTPCGAGWKGLVSVRKEEVTEDEPNQTDSQNTDKGQQAQPDNTDKKKNSKNSDKRITAALYKAEKIKDDVVNERRKRAGYVAIILKPAKSDIPNNGNTESSKPGASGLSDKELLSCHHKLVKIEECFRIMKSNFSIRPVFVRKKINICGHITLCVIALIILRLLQIKLEEAGIIMSINQIQTALNSTVTAISENGQDGFFIKNNSMDSFISIDDWKKLSLEEKKESKAGLLKKYLDEKRYSETDIDKILKVVDLEPLEGINSPSCVSKKLKIRSNYKRMVGDLLSDVQKVMADSVNPNVAEQTTV